MRIDELLRQSPANWSYPSVVGLDFGSTGLKAVRIEAVRNQVHVVDARILPPQSVESPSEGQTLDLALRGKYAACASSSEKILLRMVNAPPVWPLPAAEAAQYLRDQFGLASGFRFGAARLDADADGRLLAVAVPEPEVEGLLGRFRTGSPAVCSYGVSGLCTLNAFMRAMEGRLDHETVCLIDTGCRSSFISFIHHGQPAMVRKSDTGGSVVVDAVMRRLDVDHDTAVAIIAGQSIDISGVMQEVLDYTFRQIALARDFVEREMKTRVTRLFMAGGMSLNPYWRSAIGDIFGMECSAWDPFEGIPVMPSGWPPELQGQQIRLAAALGSCWSVVKTKKR